MQPHLLVDVACETAAQEQCPDAAAERGKAVHRSLRLDDARDGAGDALELRRLRLELAAAGSGETVVAGAAVACRRSPLGAHPPLQEHALQRRIERAFL